MGGGGRSGVVWGGHFQHHLLHLGTILAVALVSTHRSCTGEEKRGNY